MHITESQIPELIRQGRDKEAIDYLYKLLLPVVKKYILRNNGTITDAEDIFQDAIVAFYQQVIKGTFDPKYKVLGYIYKMCIYRYISKEKKNSKLQFMDELTDIPDQEIEQIEFHEKIQNESDLLGQLFQTLGEKCKELLNYSIMKGMLMEDIAIRMKMPSVAAASMQVMRCKEKLMKEIERNPEVINKLKGI